MKAVLIVVSAVIVLLGIGCAALSSYVTPAEIDGQAVAYVEKAGIVGPNEFTGYPNLYKAEKLAAAVDDAHTSIQWNLASQMEFDQLQYSRHKGAASGNLTVARQREEQLFGPQGLITLGLSLVGVGGLGGLIGLSRKRPGDVTPTELQNAVAEAAGKTAEELTEKEKQFTELVLGISRMFTTVKTLPDAVTVSGSDQEKAVQTALLKQLSATLTDEFKTLLNETQDTTTQVAVADVKARTLA